MVTPKDLVEMWGWFFRYDSDRPDIGMIAGMYESLIDLVNDIRPNKVRLLVEEKDLPFDMKYWVETINLFYDLSRRYGTQKFASIEFHLELGMWYWNFYNYLGQKYL